VNTIQRQFILSRTARRHLIVASCVGLLGILPTPSIHADTTISTSQTQNGGVLTVTPPTLLITHPTNNPLLTLTNGATTTSGVQTVIVGNLSGDEGQLAINSGSLLTTNGNGSTIGTYGGTSVANGTSYLGLNIGSTGTATISGANSSWTNSRYLSVGYYGTGMLTIQDGGIVSNSNGFIGNGSGSTGTVTVSGANSSWANSEWIEVGYYGTGMLTIQDGGSVITKNGSIGSNSTSNGTATVNGANSTWTNNQLLFVGFIGRGTLSIQNGGSVSNISGYIGYLTGSNSNGSATVNGTNSIWTNSSSLYVGYNSAGTLSIQNGGSVSNTFGYIGYTTGSNGSATVSGANSIWTNSQSLYIGGTSTNSGGSGALTISNGGKVTVAGTTKIWNSDTVTVNGGTLSTGSLDRTLGTFNFHDGFVKVNGGSYTQAGTMLMVNANAAGKTPMLELNGNGTHSAISEVRIGDNMNGSLTVSGGRKLTNTGVANLGYLSGSNGTTTVTGTGSEWINTGTTVGNEGYGTLLISAGGVVTDNNSVLGSFPGSTGTATVTDVGSLWKSNQTLLVGRQGNGTINIQAGGQVINTYAYVGRNAGTTGNVAVTGVGSQWINLLDLYVANEGNGTLNISAGGKVTSNSGYISYQAGSSGTVTVTGVGSEWINSSQLHIGGSINSVGGIGLVAVNDGGQVNVAGTTKIWHSDTLAMNTGTLKTDNLQAASASSKIQLTGNANTINLTGGTSTFIGTVEGTGGFIKAGPGTLTLNNTNTFTGTITVAEGSLIVQTTLPNNGPANISIPAPDSTLIGNPVLSRRRDINFSYAGFGATSTGGLNTMAELLSGTNLTGTDNTIAMQVRQRAMNDVGGILVSDVLNLTGMVNNPVVNPHQTDLFVLQMSYDPTLVGNDVAIASAQGLYLATFDEATNLWVNAVSTNIGGTPMFVGDTPWNSSYLTLGQFGVDTNANVVWAVINHNSQFAVVPEPSTWVMGTLTALGLSAAAMRRRLVKQSTSVKI
jgi:T5SS/PEP-CTERM-associated repeat protein